MKLSKEIKGLLEKENGELQINEAFKLVRWTLKKDDDVIGREGEHLKVEMIPVNDGRRNFFAKEIESRDVQGIIDEVAAGMEEILEKYSEQLVSRWKGGLD